MAWIFQLAAEFGDDRVAAETFSTCFNGIQWKLKNGFETSVGCWSEAGHTGAWWSIAVPSGVSGSGHPRNSEEARIMTEVALLLYERLRSAPPYRFAWVGAEVFDFRDVEDLPEILSAPSIHGLVLSEELWIKFAKPSLYVPFAPGYWWRPYLGEQFPPPPV